MKKKIIYLRHIIGLCVICMMTFSLYVSAANARICFLPGANCEEDADSHSVIPNSSGGGGGSCTLVSPLPNYVCEKCTNGRYKCSGCKKDYKLDRGECVCDGDDCSTMRDKYCPAAKKNSCGLCETGNCMCRGTKCTETQKCNGSLNACGNCSGKCVDMDKCSGDWNEEKPTEGCYDTGTTPDGSKPCYLKRECTCAEDGNKCKCRDRGWQDNDICEGDKIAVKKDVLNGTQCYSCSEKKCSYYGADYYDNTSSCTSCEKPTLVDSGKVGGLTCYECPKVTTCSELDLADTKDDECFSTNTEDARCKTSVGHACWKNLNPKSCDERGLSDAKDTECFKTYKENKKCEKACWENTDEKSCDERGLSIAKDEECFKKSTEDKRCRETCWKNENAKSCEERGAGLYTKKQDCQNKCTDGTCVEDQTCGEDHTCFRCKERNEIPCQNVNPNTCACGTTKNDKGCTICKTDCKCSDYNSSYQDNDKCANSCKKAKQVDANTVGGLTCYHCNDDKSCKDFNSTYKSSCTCNRGQVVSASVLVDKSEVCNLTCYSKCECHSGGGGGGGTGGSISGDTSTGGATGGGYPGGGDTYCDPSGEGYSTPSMPDSFSEPFLDVFSDPFSDVFSNPINPVKYTSSDCGGRNCDADYPGQNRKCCVTKQCHNQGTSKVIVCDGVQFLCVLPDEECREKAIVETELPTNNGVDE